MDQANLENLAEQLLGKIRTRPKNPYQPTYLSRSFKVSPENIIEAAALLGTWGYNIKIDSKKQIIFNEAPDKFLSIEIAYKLKTRLIGKEIIAYQSVQSTNIIAQVLAVSGAVEGTLIVSEHQKKGKGRFGRTWYSPPETGLYCSVILKPDIHPSKAPGISLVAALAVADAIKTYGDLDVKIKWPNDVLISGKKVCGILTELSGEFDRAHFVVVGVGANINQQLSDFPSSISKNAGSIRIALGKKIKRVEFLQRFLRNFEKDYLAFRSGGLKKMRKRILKYSPLPGHEIELRNGLNTIKGNVLDIDDDGRLVIESASGKIAFNSGEVTTRIE